MGRMKGGIVLDSFILTIVRVITALIGIAVAKLLAVSFSIEEYGIYSQAMLVATTGTSLTILGLTDATNYFFNKTREINTRAKYMATVFGIQFIFGLVFAVGVIVFNGQISNYFNNPSLKHIIPYIAFIPMLNNIMNMLQVLFVSAGKAKLLAIRNFVLAVVKVLYVWITCITIRDIKAIIICLLIVEIGTTLYMWLYVERHVSCIRISSFNKGLIKEILMYSIPMAGYIVTNSMSRNMDKLIVGRLGTTSDLAIYSIASKELPFDLLTAAFVTVLIPYITRYIGAGDNESASKAFSKYIQISYLVTWPIGFGAMVSSRDLMSILYDDKYLIGLSIFAVYILVDMIRFANVSLIFSAKAKTNELLLYSLCALAANIVLNIVLFKTMGLIGPAVATFIIMLFVNCIMLVRSSKLLESSVFEIVNFGQMLLLIIEIIIVGMVVSLLRRYILDLPLFVRFFVSYLSFITPMLFLNCKRLIKNLKELNAIRKIY